MKSHHQDISVSIRLVVGAADQRQTDKEHFFFFKGEAGEPTSMEKYFPLTFFLLFLRCWMSILLNVNC